MEKYFQDTDYCYHAALFGALTIRRGGESIVLPASTPARSLLAYLLLNRQRTHARTVLAGIFWGEQPEERARRALSHAVWQLRSSLPGLIVAEGETIGITQGADVWIDAEEFAQKSRAGIEGAGAEARSLLYEAHRIYRGELLDGSYAEWVILERERLRLVHQQDLEELIRLEKAAGHFQQALELGLELVKSDPLQESAHREVMRLHFLLDHPQAALQQYAACQALLRNELDVEPEAETQALAEEILRREGEGAAAYLPQGFERPRPVRLDGSHPTALPLVGRGREREELLACLEDALESRGGMALVEGEAGVGKTRLLQEIARDAQWRGAQVLWGQANELAASKPYGLLVDALEGGISALLVEKIKLVVEPLWLQVLKPLLPILSTFIPDLANASPLEPQEEQARLAEAVFRLLKAWRDRVPLVIHLEDLQWADEDTLRLLPFIVPRLGEAGILVICSYRGEEARARKEVWEKLQSLDKSAQPRRVKLDRLDSKNTAELIRLSLALRSTAPLFENRIHQETGGNPLFVLEVLRTLQDSGLLKKSAEGEWATPWDESTDDYKELPLPPLVERVIAQRLSTLPDTERKLLHLCAALGNRLDLPVLRATSSYSSELLLDTLGSLTRRYILQEAPDAYRFVHEMTRVVAYAEMREEERLGCHRQAVAALEKVHSEQVDALAYHSTAGGEWEKATRYHKSAAKMASAAHAHAAACFHLETALSLLEKLPPDAGEGFTLLLDHEKIQEILGNRAAQEADLERMLRLAGENPGLLAHARTRQAWFLVYTDRYDEAEKNARQALELARGTGDTALQAEVLSILGTVCNWRGQIPESVPLLQEALDLQAQSGEGESEARYRRSLANALLGIKDYPAALRELDQTLEQARQAQDSLGQVEALNLLGILHMEKGELEEATSAYQEALTLSQSLGYLYGEARSLVNLGTLYYFQAKMGSMLDCYDRAIAIFQHIQSRRGEAQVRLNRASISLTFLGDTRQASRDAEAAVDYYREIGDALSEGQGLIVLAESDRQQGNMVQALRQARKGVKILAKAGEHFLEAQAERELGWVEIEAGDYPAAAKHLEHALATCQQFSLTDLEPGIIGLRSMALMKQGRLEEARLASEEAMSRLKPGLEQDYLLPYWHAQVMESLGRTSEAQDAIRQANALLTKALEEFSPEQRAMSLEGVPEHRQIAAAWRRLAPAKVVVHLPGLVNRTEKVAVTWTLDCQEDRHIQNKVERRQNRLTRLLREAREQGAAPSHQDLAEALGVGLRTVERDIALIEEKNK